MKALILAAGRGRRMGSAGENIPKCLIQFEGRALLEWQLSSLRAAGINTIGIVTGYCAEQITVKGVTRFHNPNFETTNMVESLMCAREFLQGDVVIAYGDVIYTPALVMNVASYTGAVVVAVDKGWRGYWQARYGTTETDLESLDVRGEKITALGKPITSSLGLDYRYIGLLKFADAVWPKVFELYQQKRETSAGWKSSGKSFLQGYMTDLISELIENGADVRPCVSEREWLEFDTAEDLAQSTQAVSTGTIQDFFNINSLVKA